MQQRDDVWNFLLMSRFGKLALNMILFRLSVKSLQLKYSLELSKIKILSRKMSAKDSNMKISISVHLSSYIM